VEHRVLRGDHYARADLAAAAVRARVPAGEPLTVVVYEGDRLNLLDCDTWFEYRIRWLLYPRSLRVARVPVGGGAERLPGYVLSFRVTAPPTAPERPHEVLSRGPMFILARTRAQ
jgi:hypothetical protein